MPFRICGRLALLAIYLVCCDVASAEHLHLAATIPLGDVTGRIDHLAVDDARKRLFVAELGSGRVAVVDVDARKVLQTIDGLSEPQGVAYEPTTDTLFVANGGDGSVRSYAGATYAPAGRIDLHEDADNVRVDAAHHSVLVGYGSGLASIDVATHAVRTVPLGAHPESFQINAGTSQVFVNVPHLHALIALDADGRVQRRPIPLSGANYPLALDDRGQLVLPLRNPPALLVMPVSRPSGDGPTSSADVGPSPGAVVEHASGDERAPVSAELCDDADDVFYDAGRQRLYVSCGDGHLDVFQRTDSGYARIDHIPTANGARTSLFVAAWDRLFLAVPAAGASAPAVLWVMEPN